VAEISGKKAVRACAHTRVCVCVCVCVCVPTETCPQRRARVAARRLSPTRKSL
jgi:hypothetical protein